MMNQSTTSQETISIQRQRLFSFKMFNDCISIIPFSSINFDWSFTENCM